MARFRDHNGRETPFTMVSNEILRDAELSGLAKLVYTLLRMHADNDGGNCFPGVPTLCELAGLAPTSKRRIITAIAELEQCGYLTVKRRIGFSNLYILQWTRSQSATGRAGGPVANQLRPRSQSATGGRSQSATLPIPMELNPVTRAMKMEPEHEECPTDIREQLRGMGLFKGI